MRETWAQLGNSRASDYVLALVLTAIVTAALAGIDQAADVANISMLYLLAVLASAALFGSGPAIVSAVAAFLAFNFFFIEPRYTFKVANEDEWLALGLLLATGAVAGQLAAALSNRAREAERREKEAVVLYDVVRLMSEPELQRALTSVAERLRAELSLAVVVVAVGDDNAVRAQADTGNSEAIALAHEAQRLPEMIMGGGKAPTAASRATPGRWIRIVQPALSSASKRARHDRVRVVPVNLGDQRVGSIVLVRAVGAPEFGEAEDRLLSAVALQLALAIQRLRLQREAMEAEVLRRTDELRTALINAVSHDLRTPLASIIASAGTLLQEDVRWKGEDRREFTQAIVEEAERLNRLVGNLLDLSRIEAGSIRPEKGWYDLGSLVNEVAGRLHRLAASHRLLLDVPDDLLPVYFDYVEIDQVITNLVENALKYTPPGSEIRVSARVSEGAVLVEVSDNGPGIPPEALPHVFKPFYGAEGATGARGSGLGLAVARGLVEAHGGRIWVENRTEGGARFVFTIPLGEQPAAVA
jgi:two-component system sensor histidine kinase KdpD